MYIEQISIQRTSITGSAVRVSLTQERLGDDETKSYVVRVNDAIVQTWDHHGGWDAKGMYRALVTALSVH